MMPVWIVMIKDTNRWIDSVWVQEEGASNRVDTVITAMKASGVYDPCCWMVKSQIEDGVLGTKRTSPKKNLGS